MSVEPEHLLIHRFFDRSLLAGEKEDLEALLLSSAEARAEFRRTGRIHGLLTLTAEMAKGRNAAATDTVLPLLRTKKFPQHKTRIALILTGLAACLAILFTFNALKHREKTIPPAILSGLASIDLTTNLEWGKNSRKPRGNQIDAGSYHLNFGTLRLEMGAGADVCISAPSKFEILSNREIKVEFGKLTARLPKKEDELIITMPGLKLTDLGTGFGVDVDQAGEALVSVFEGKVSLEEKENSTPTILAAGRSVRHTTANEQSLKPLKFDASPFRDLWPLTLGIDDVSDLVRFIPPAPADQTFFSFQDRDHVFLLPEQQAIVLETPLITDLSTADATWPNSGHLSSIPTGRQISSYLVFYNPPKGDNVPVRNLTGTITFNREILGVICTADPLSLSDKVVGIALRENNLSANRKLESADGIGGELPHDTVTLSADRRSIHFSFSARQGIDNMRIILDDD